MVLVLPGFDGKVAADLGFEAFCGKLGAAEGGVVSALQAQGVSGGDLGVVVGDFAAVGLALLTTRAKLEADAGLLAEADGSTDRRLGGEGRGEEECQNRK